MCVNIVGNAPFQYNTNVHTRMMILCSMSTHYEFISKLNQFIFLYEWSDFMYGHIITILYATYA